MQYMTSNLILSGENIVFLVYLSSIHLFFFYSTTIVSSGADQMIRVWNLSDVEVEEPPRVDLNTVVENKTRWTSDNYRTFKCVPHDIVFKPDSSMLAVAEKWVSFLASLLLQYSCNLSLYFFSFIF